MVTLVVGRVVVVVAVVVVVVMMVVVVVVVVAVLVVMTETLCFRTCSPLIDSLIYSLCIRAHVTLASSARTSSSHNI